MNKLKKWIIDNEKNSNEFSKKSLKFRLKTIKNNIEDYLKNPNEDTLHEIRISVRRLRYSMEVFFVFFQKNKYYEFYNKLKEIQDETGEIRDMDIIKKTMNKSESKKLDKKRNKLEKDIDKKLKKFLEDNIYYNFSKIIKH